MTVCKPVSIVQPTAELSDYRSAIFGRAACAARLPCTAGDRRLGSTQARGRPRSGVNRRRLCSVAQTLPGGGDTNVAAVAHDEREEDAGSGGEEHCAGHGVQERVGWVCDGLYLKKQRALCEWFTLSGKGRPLRMDHLPF